MREKWKRVWARRPRLSRGQKVVRNLLLCTLILIWFWGLEGYPLPTGEMKFRRMERASLAPRSKIVYNSKRDDPVQWRDLPELNRLRELIIGVRDGHVHVYEPDSKLFQCHSVGDGIAPFPLYDISTIWSPQNNGTGILFFQIPEEAERAELDISGIDRYRKELHFQEEGWRLAPGLWLFTAMVSEPGGYRHLDGWCIGGDYTLTLYRADGSVLAEQSGSFEGTHS